MKTVLDFSRVPLDKWIDLYESVEKNSHVYESLSDIKKFAQTQVKEQSDYDKDIAEACAEYFASAFDTDKYIALSKLLDARKVIKPVKEDKVETEVRSTVDLKDIPF